MFPFINHLTGKICGVDKFTTRRHHHMALCLAMTLVCGCPATISSDTNVSDQPDSTTVAADSDASCKCLEDAQVLLEVKFVTTTSNFLEDIGIDLDQSFKLNSVSPTGSSYGPGPFNTSAVGFVSSSAGETDFIVNSLSPDTEANENTNAISGMLLDDVVLDQLIMATEGKGEILSAPQITTQFGQTALMVLSNESVTLPELNSEFEQALITIDPLINPIFTGPSFEVSPRVAEDNTIILDIHPTTSALFFTPDAGDWRPLVQGSNVQTTISLKDGQTVVLGGLIDENDMKTESVLPLFGDIPVLSRLFDNRLFVTEESNLLIMITAQIIDSNEP